MESEQGNASKIASVNNSRWMEADDICSTHTEQPPPLDLSVNASLIMEQSIRVSKSLSRDESHSGATYSLFLYRGCPVESSQLPCLEPETLPTLQSICFRFACSFPTMPDTTVGKRYNDPESFHDHITDLYSVRRADLRSPSRSASPDDTAVDIEEAVRAQLRSAIELDFVDVTEHSKDANAPDEDEGAQEEDTFAFKLFSTAGKPADDAAKKEENAFSVQQAKAPNIQLISLAEDEPMPDPASLLPPPERPLSYYIANPATAAEKARYASAAMTGEDIIQLSKTPWPGMSYNWRIISTTSSMSPALTTASIGSSSTSSADPEQASKHKRTRLGKKSRIKLRMKLQTKVAKQKEKEEQDKAKEAHLRDKKTRMNRAKQLRKREKARLAKGEASGPDDLAANEEE